MAGEANARPIRELQMREVSCRLIDHTFRTCMVAARGIPLEGSLLGLRHGPESRYVQYNSNTRLVILPQGAGTRICANWNGKNEEGFDPGISISFYP